MSVSWAQASGELNIKPVPAGLTGPHPAAGDMRSQAIPAPGAENPGCTRPRQGPEGQSWLRCLGSRGLSTPPGPWAQDMAATCTDLGKATPASGAERCLERVQLDSGWPPIPYPGQHKAYEQLGWRPPTSGAQQQLQPISSGGPTLYALSWALSRQPPPSLASHAPALRPLWEPPLIMPASWMDCCPALLWPLKATHTEPHCPG